MRKNPTSLAGSSLPRQMPSAVPVTPKRPGRPRKAEGTMSSTDRSRKYRAAKKIDEIVTTGDTGGRQRNEVIGIDTEVVHNLREGRDAVFHNPNPEEMLLPDPNTLHEAPQGGDVRSRTGGGIGHEGVGHDHDRDEPADMDDDVKGEAPETKSTFVRRQRFPLNWADPTDQELRTRDFVEENFTVIRDDRLERVGDEWMLKNEYDDLDEETLNLKPAELHCALCHDDGQNRVITAAAWEVSRVEWAEAYGHIVDEHREELRKYLRAFVPGRIKFPPKCSAADHERMRSNIAPGTTGRVQCGVCNRVIYQSDIASKKLPNVHRPKNLKKDPVDRGNLG